MQLLLHPAAQLKIQSIISHPGKTVMLHGAKGVGKRTIAKEIARKLNCLGCQNEDCRSCRMILGANHPDVILVNPDDKGKIGIEQIHQLLHDLQYEQYAPKGLRVVIIYQSHLLTLPAQNALLKVLEEPPGKTTIILTCEYVESLLPTVISRCRTIHIPPLTEKELVRYIRDQYADQADNAVAIAQESQGSAGLAISFANSKNDFEQHQARKEAAIRLMRGEDLFEALRIAAEMAASNQVVEYAAALMAASRQIARQDKHIVALGATLRLHQRLSSNVSPRSAFEALAVEMS